MKSNENRQNGESGGAGMPELKGSRSFLRELGLKFGLVLVAVLWLMLMASTWAQASDDGTGEYSFDWLDPDKKIYVLQNRKFRKASHFNVNLLAGPGINSAYRDEWNLEPRASFYFTESWGVEFFYRKTFSSPSNAFKALEASSPQTFPLIRESRGSFGASLHWVPWYAKLNMFNQILYFDWYFGAGAGMVQTTSGYKSTSNGDFNYTDNDYFALYANTGHIYYVSQVWSLRLDIQGTFYRAALNYNLPNKVWYSSTNVAFGLGLSL